MLAHLSSKIPRETLSFSLEVDPLAPVVVAEVRDQVPGILTRILPMDHSGNVVTFESNSNKVFFVRRGA